MSRPTIERLMNAVARTAVAAAAGVLLAAAATAQDPGWREMAEREARRAAEAQRAQLIRQRYERRRSAAHARMRSEDAGTLYASTPGPAHGQLSCPAEPTAETPSVFDRFITERADGTLLINIGDSRPTGTGRQATNSAPPYWPETLLPVLPQPGSALDFGIAHADLSITGARGDAASARTSAPQGIPFFPSASDAQGRLGIARFVNRSPQAGNVYVEAIDDSGRRYGPLTLSIAANETVHIDSGDLENGNADKGLFGGTGQGVGDWRLELSSDLDVEVASYVRSWDGLLMPMHDVAPSDQTGHRTSHRVAIFNPASHQGQESRLRLTNPGDEPAEVAITGIDSLGNAPATGVSVTIPPGASVTYTAAELESGNGAGLLGSLGAGTGEWRFVVESQQPLTVMNLLSSSTGHVTNLSTAPANETRGVHAVPLFPAASDPSGNRGIVRVINRGDTAGDVHIEAFDDTQWDYAPLVLRIGLGEAVHFDSNDLEQGNPAKGLAGSTGAGQGDWRLELTSDVDIEVLSYVRAWDGLLTAMHDVVPSEAEGTRHRVAMLDPEGQWDRESQLRLINPGSEPAEVSISGKGSARTPLGAGVSVTIPAGVTRTYTVAELGSGNGIGLRGSLGEATAESQLAVESDRPLMAMNLLTSPTGHLTNLSTAPIRGLKGGPPVAATDDDPPATESAEDVFETLVSSIVQSKCVFCHVEGGVSGNTRLVFVPNTNEDHEALNLAAFEAFIGALEEDEQVENPVAYVLNKVQGVAHGGGVQVAAGTTDYGSLERLLGILGEAVAPVGITPETLFEGVVMESPRSTLRRAAIVFAGRVPTQAEYAAVKGGSEDALRTTIRGLMTGPGFHEFLIRASNDRLLTDRDDIQGLGVINPIFAYFVDYNNLNYEKLLADDPNYWQWYGDVDYGIARAPLELIAHVVENDLPYTEILTADYIMANPMADEAYGGTSEFDDPSDVHEFKPTRIDNYFRDCDGKETENTPGIGTRVLDPGSCPTDYPHAGILNTTVFLKRYPTTATNRNRARSRWTYYHFLGVDIEKSAPRTIDPVALADTNNPTMGNAACTVCHSVLDPVAGAFQNYDDIGYYRSAYGGLDSLDEQYKDGGEQQAVDVAAETYASRETVSAAVRLSPAGLLAVRFANDYWDPESGHDRNVFVDSLSVREQDSGDTIFEIELEDLTENDLGDGDCGLATHSTHFAFYSGCRLRLDVGVPVTGTYLVEAVAWADQHGSELAKLAFSDTLYRDGDAWYRDMRTPGFSGQSAANAHNSLQWLAEQIVTDERFAEATVKFWWPGIMGSEIAEPPEEGDASFDGRLLASNAQVAEVERLAAGFRAGISDGEPYNLKDLLTEIVLSKWFRASSLTDDEPVRAEALSAAGAKRLLTPEELSRKTLALTGFGWERRRPSNSSWLSWLAPSASARADWSTQDSYGLLYGGIDSGGIAERARDITPIMGGVAKLHASAVACPVVFKDFFLLEDGERQLFGGVNRSVSPAHEFGAIIDVDAESRANKRVFPIQGSLQQGQAQAVVSLTNELWNEDVGSHDRQLYLDRLVLRNHAGNAIQTHEFENLDHRCAWDVGDAIVFWDTCPVSVPLDIPATGAYEIEVTAWAEHEEGARATAGDDFAKMEIVLEGNAETSAGAGAIKAKLAELYGKLLGVSADADDPEIEAAYELFVAVWESNLVSSEPHSRFDMRCDWDTDQYYFDGIVDDAWLDPEDGEEWDWGRHGFDDETVRAYFDTIDWSDRRHVARTWVVLLAYLLTDYRYLFL